MPAHAQFPDACGGTDFFSCFNVVVSASNGGKTETFTFTNLSNTAPANNPSSVFKLLGLGSSSSVVPLSISTASSNFTTTCSGNYTGCDFDSRESRTQFNGAGFTPNDFFGLYADSPAPTNGLKDGQSVAFSLIFNSAANATSFLTGVEYAFQDIGGPGSCGSSKAAFTANGTAVTASARRPIGGRATAPRLALPSRRRWRCSALGSSDSSPYFVSARSSVLSMMKQKGPPILVALSVCCKCLKRAAWTLLDAGVPRRVGRVRIAVRGGAVHYFARGMPHPHETEEAE